MCTLAKLYAALHRTTGVWERGGITLLNGWMLHSRSIIDQFFTETFSTTKTHCSVCISILADDNTLGVMVGILSGGPGTMSWQEDLLHTQIYRPISSQPFSAGCHGNRNWRPIWKVAWWARVSCRRSRMYGIQCKLVQFCPVIPDSTVFFLSEPVSCRGQWIACSNGKRNRSFTKNITTFAAVVEILIAMFFLPFSFFLSIAIRSIGVHHTVPGYIDQNVFGLQRTAKKTRLSLHEKL